MTEPFPHEQRAALDVLQVLVEGLACDGDAVPVEHVAQLQHQRRDTASSGDLLVRDAGPAFIHFMAFRMVGASVSNGCVGGGSVNRWP